jgi:ring-1,2-phenylacetyl-CoA epoxidase subunit PaaD
LVSVPATLGATQTNGVAFASHAEHANIWALLRTIPDPEIPVISICDLGIVREVSDEAVTITPTYSGCPAMHAIEESVRAALDAQGYAHLAVRTALAPAWTTDWISDEGREKLRAYGIAPPHVKVGAGGTAVGTAGGTAGDIDSREEKVIKLHRTPRKPLVQDSAIHCPHCGSAHTETLSAFGSTACKSLMRCIDCREPFDLFKPV